MRNHPSKQRYTKFKQTNSDQKDSIDNLNLVADELNALARSRLPDRVFRGALEGMEPDIRQDAVLLAYSWYLRCAAADPTGPHDWIAARAIAAALKICKRDALKASARDMRAIQPHVEEVNQGVPHPTRWGRSDWPLHILQSLIEQAIRKALKDGAISTVNAAVCLRVFVEQTPVREVARQLGVHRSSIYQHLNRVSRHLPDIIDGIEINYRDLI